MTGELTMSTWTVTYHEHGLISSGDNTAATVETDAAYYSVGERFVEFKDTDHQVVFALNSSIVATISRRAGAGQQAVEA